MRGTRSNEAQLPSPRVVSLSFTDSKPTSIPSQPRSLSTWKNQLHNHGESLFIRNRSYSNPSKRVPSTMPRNGKKTFSFSFFLSLSSTIFRIRREIYLAPPDFLFFSQTWKSLNPHCEQETRSLFFNPFFFQRGFYIRIYINISICNNIEILKR